VALPESPMLGDGGLRHHGGRGLSRKGDRPVVKSYVITPVRGRKAAIPPILSTEPMDNLMTIRPNGPFLVLLKTVVRGG